MVCRMFKIDGLFNVGNKRDEVRSKAIDLVSGSLFALEHIYHIQFKRTNMSKIHKTQISKKVHFKEYAFKR